MPRNKQNSRKTANGFIAEAQGNTAHKINISPIPQAVIRETINGSSLFACFYLKKGDKQAISIRWSKNVTAMESTGLKHAGDSEITGSKTEINTENPYDLLEKGYDEKLGSFIMRFGYPDLDAALLRIPLMEFLTPEDERVHTTVNKIMEKLMVNDLVYRYRMDDGLPGEEGAFGLCTFWLVDVLSLMGRVDEAKRIYNGMLSRANHLGLFSEEIDVKNGAFLGNFPQAFTHIGVINSALYLSWAQGQPVPEYAPIGTPQHRNTIGRIYK